MVAVNELTQADIAQLAVSADGLRSYAADHLDRRRVDGDLARVMVLRAAVRIDELESTLADADALVRRRPAHASVPDPSPVAPASTAGSDHHDEAALLMLQQARKAAEELLAAADDRQREADVLVAKAAAVAESEAAAIVGRADAERHRLLAQARSEAAEIVTTARAEADEIASRHGESTRLLADLRAQVEGLLRLLDRSSADLSNVRAAPSPEALRIVPDREADAADGPAVIDLTSPEFSRR